MTPAPASDRTSRLRLVGVRSPLRAFALVGAGCGRSPRLDALKSAQEHVLALRNVHSPGIFVDGLVVARQTAQMDDQQQLSSVLLESGRPSRLSTATTAMRSLVRES